MKNNKLSYIIAKDFLKYCQERRTYLFLAKPDAWGTLDVAPIGSQESTSNSFQDFRDTFFAKEILDGAFSLVIRRVDWESKVFDQWESDDPLITEKDFYCLTSTNHVYKCLSNNQGSVSTIEPSNIGVDRFETADGYIWKYMFSVNSNDALMFLTPDWIPVKEVFTSIAGYENQYASQTAAINGTIDRVDIIQPGSKYSNLTTANVVGDGTGATVSLTINEVTGAIEKVDVLSYGQNYTWANIVITDPSGVPGSGAIFKVVVSPQYGHGFNPSEELGTSTVIASVKVEGSEAGSIEGDISFRKALIVTDPKEVGGDFASGFRYNTAVKATLTSEVGTFISGERVSFPNGSGVVVFHSSGVLGLVDVVGSPSGNVVGIQSEASATISEVAPSPLVMSGAVIFKSYFNPRTKAIDENVDFKPIFKF